MPVIKFTAKTIQGLEPAKVPQIDYWDVEQTGFGIRVTASGRKAWFAYYRVGSRKRRYTIGTFPTLSLHDARAMARQILNEAAMGADPAKRKTDERSADTMFSLAHDYLERHAKIKKRSWREDERMLKTYVLPSLGALKAVEVQKRDILRLTDEIVARGAPIQANRVFSLVKRVFNFGIERDLVPFNPCQTIKRPANEQQRDRVLNFEEIKKVWTAIEGQQPVMSCLLKLYLLTAQRGVEIRSMKWKDIDLANAWWTIPSIDAKNGKSHRVPLCEMAIFELSRIKSYSLGDEWVFLSPVDKAKPIENVQKAIQRVQKKSGVDFVGHDLRRTVATHMASLGVSRLVISRILNHTEGGVTFIYDRHSYDQEKQNAFLKWENKIRHCLGFHPKDLKLEKAV